MSTLGDAKLLRLRMLHVPPGGGWYADLDLDATTLPTVGAIGGAVLTVGDLQLIGTVTQAGFDDHPDHGARVRVTVEGGAGWAKPLARAGAYQSADGVRLLTVLRDLAGLAGEPYDAPADFALPASFRWPASTPREPVTGADVLNEFARLGAFPVWRVDPTGRTRFDAWPSLGAADASGRVLRRSLSAGKRVVGLDTRVAAFLPGSTLEGVATRRLIVKEDASKLTAEVYST